MIEVDGLPLSDVSVEIAIPRVLFDDKPLAATEPWKRAALSSARRQAKRAGQTLASDTPHFQLLTFVRSVDDTSAIGYPHWEDVAFQDCEVAIYRAVWACEQPT